mmetsp:Transcript_43745/g.50309  ORF Transcript_43745/g.50309 Transcript_43745/m.50309 type:complete len:452 (+) Transcript_43745:151-1506(+)
MDKVGGNFSSKFKEFQVVLLAGGDGQRLYPLVDDIPKCLLPVGNKPLIAYQLEWLEKNHGTDVVVVIQQKYKSVIENYLRDVYIGDLKFEIVTLDERLATADVLRFLSSKLVREFMVISADTILDDSACKIFDFHRIQEPDVTVVLQEQASDNEKKSKGTIQDSFDVIALDSRQQRLLMVADNDDVREEGVNISRELFIKHPRIDLKSNLLDYHIYIFRPWVIKLLEEKEDISSIKLDLVPYLIDNQYNSDVIEIRKSFEKKGAIDEDDDDDDEPTEEQANRSGEKNLKCSAYVISSDKYGQRCNTIRRYTKLSQQLLQEQIPKCLQVTPNSSANLLTEYRGKDQGDKPDFLRQVGEECVISDTANLESRINIQKSIIGKNCKIGTKVKITDSILMDNVVIGTGCNIKGCIMSNGVEVEPESKVFNCQVSSGFCISEGSQLTGETLTKELL